MVSETENWYSDFRIFGCSDFRIRDVQIRDNRKPSRALRLLCGLCGKVSYTEIHRDYWDSQRFLSDNHQPTTETIVHTFLFWKTCTQNGCILFRFENYALKMVAYFFVLKIMHSKWLHTFDSQQTCTQLITHNLQPTTHNLQPIYLKSFYLAVTFLL